MEMRFCVAALQHADRCVGDQTAKEGDDARSLVCDKDQEEKKSELSSLSLLFPHLDPVEPQRFSHQFRIQRDAANPAPSLACLKVEVLCDSFQSRRTDLSYLIAPFQSTHR